MAEAVGRRGGRGGAARRVTFCFGFFWPFPFVALLGARPPSHGADARSAPHYTPSLRHPPSVWYKFLDGERGGETQTSPTCESAGAAVSAASAASDVQSVRLSRRSCMMSVESLYDSSESVSSSAIASSKACFAIERRGLQEKTRIL